MTGNFKGRMPERAGAQRYFSAEDLLEGQRVEGRWRRIAKDVLFYLALAAIVLFVYASFALAPDWYAEHWWKVQHETRKILNYRVDPLTRHLQALVQTVDAAGLPQGPGAWMTAAGLYGGVPVAIKVNAAGALSLGALQGGTPARCIGCIVIGGLNGGVPVALAVDSYGDVNATGGQFGTVCAPGDISVACLKDEFIGGQGTLANVGVGDLRWSNATIGSASTFTGLTGASPNLGLLQWTTASGQGDGSSIQLNGQAGNIYASLNTLGSAAPWDSEWIVEMSSTANTRMRVGFMNSLATCYTTNVTSISATCDGFWVRYDTNTPAAVNVGNNGITRSAGGVVTVTVATHGMSLVGQSVTIAGATGCTTSPNGTFVVASIPSTTTYTFAQAGAAETCGGNAPATSTPVVNNDYFFETKSGAGTPVAYAIDSGVAGAASQFFRFRIQSTTAGTICFSIFGNTGTLLTGPTCSSTDVATTTMVPDIHFVSDTAGTKVIDVDYFSYAATGLAR